MSRTVGGSLGGCPTTYVFVDVTAPHLRGIIENKTRKTEIPNMLNRCGRAVPRLVMRPKGPAKPMGGGGAGLSARTTAVEPPTIPVVIKDIDEAEITGGD